jgi:hypothetical protein
MALMEPPAREVYWLGPCLLCSERFCADLAWLASTYGPTDALPAECPRCDPLAFLEMPFVHQPWHG